MMRFHLIFAGLALVTMTAVTVATMMICGLGVGIMATCGQMAAIMLMVHLDKAYKQTRPINEQHHD